MRGVSGSDVRGASCPEAEAIAALIDGSIDARTGSSLWHHFDDCARCFDVYVESQWFIRSEKLGYL